MGVLNDAIERWLCVSNGNGCGNGNGNGYGNGYGNGNGIGNGIGIGNGNGNGIGNGTGIGNGNGTGNGNGIGNGYGIGYGIQEFDGYTVYSIDDTTTCITSLHGNIAKGFTIKRNSIKVPCYIAKVGNCFAHGETAHKALEDATNKALQAEPIDKRIKKIKAEYPDPDTKITNKRLFALHNVITGSCEFGRREFCKAHDIDVDNGKMAMREFINLTKSAYGSDNIRLLADAYGIELRDDKRSTQHQTNNAF